MGEHDATIKEVAKMAEVSIGTVSNVLNGLKTVKEDNRQRVLKAMDELSYIPNRTAQSLKTNKSKTIGLILPTIMNPFYPAVAKGIEDTASRMGYITVLCNTDRDDKKEKSYIEMLISTMAAGVVLIKSRLSAEQIRKYSQKIKIVMVDSAADFNEDIDIIEANNYEGSFKAVDYLYDLGHRKIAYIAGSLNAKSSIERLNAYKDAITSRDMDLNDDYIKMGNFSIDSGYEYGMELLKMESRPTAICCGNDMMAIGVIKAASELGINVPSEVSVIGFDDIDMAALITPALTTIKHPKYEQGQRAARILLNMIKNEGSHVPKNYVLGVELKIRSSTAKCIESHD